MIEQWLAKALAVLQAAINILMIVEIFATGNFNEARANEAASTASPN
jgi:hypothetical protein